MAIITMGWILCSLGFVPCQWRLTLPLIARCKAAIWSALHTLIKV